MPRTRPEDFLSTVRTTAARPGQILDVLVLTSDGSLLDALRSAAGSEHALWDAPSADAAVDYLVGGRCDVLIADLGTLRDDVAALLDKLQMQFPELIFMATGRREEEGAVASLLSSGRLYRFLHKPISPGRAFQFLNAATRRYNELRDGQPIVRQAARTVARKRSPYFGQVLAAGGGLLAAVIAFVVWQSGEQGLPATLQTTQVGDSSLEEKVKSKLGSAQIALLSGRLIDPRGDNALEYYKGVLAMQADNADAKAGMQKVIDTLEQRVVKALQERNAPRVVSAWTALQRAAPNHPQLDALRAQLLALSRSKPKPTQAVADNVRSEAPSADDGSSAADVSSAVTDETASLAASSPDVSSPDAANVEASLIAAEVAQRELAEAIAREMAEQEAAADEQQRLAFVLLDRSRTALAANDIDEAATLIDRADKLIPGTQAVRVLQEQLSKAQEERDFTKSVAQAASLKRVREVPPVYPREAAREGTEGWVQVEFTIAPDGSTRDLLVRDSAPKAVFDKAALESVSKWRFEPVRNNGAPVAQRAVLQVRFVLN